MTKNSAAIRRSQPRLRLAQNPPVQRRRNAPQGPLGVVDQVRVALRPKNRLATALGGVLGGFVPLATYVVAHYELDLSRRLYAQLATLFVVGGLLYSATTVYTWGCQAFCDRRKAVGFVLLTEGVLVASGVEWLSLAALALLVSINGIATGCNLSAPATGDR